MKRYYLELVPMAAIRRFARKIAELFHPHKIILFGSYAYGKPNIHSDVDLLVVMPTRNQVQQAVRIDEAIEDRGFALDLSVRTPKTLETRLRWGDSFLQEVVARGKVLYEKANGRMGAKSRHRRRSAIAQVKTASPIFRTVPAVEWDPSGAYSLHKPIVETCQISKCSRRQLPAPF